jgi:hypothetical protein
MTRFARTQVRCARVAGGCGGQFRAAARQQSIAAELQAWPYGTGIFSEDVAEEVAQRQDALRALQRALRHRLRRPGGGAGH